MRGVINASGGDETGFLDHNSQHLASLANTTNVDVNISIPLAFTSFIADFIDGGAESSVTHWYLSVMRSMLTNGSNFRYQNYLGH